MTNAEQFALIQENMNHSRKVIQHGRIILDYSNKLIDLLRDTNDAQQDSLYLLLEAEAQGMLETALEDIETYLPGMVVVEPGRIYSIR